ncbi:hypothetical protein MC885_017355 [Smutsia gigantea]|nr:hypothetical protein MC885_017355 [Smutsia gigantea]
MFPHFQKNIFSRVIFVPENRRFLLLLNEVSGLPKLEDKLATEKLIVWTSSQNISKRDVDLYLAQFKVEESYDLKILLGAMGIVNAFRQQDSDFLGMPGSGGVKGSTMLLQDFAEAQAVPGATR